MKNVEDVKLEMKIGKKKVFKKEIIIQGVEGSEKITDR